MTAANIQTTTFAATLESAILMTTAHTVETANRPILTASEQLAAYCYDDALALLRRTQLNLARALDAPATFHDDPDLFLKLVCADFEQLMRDELITRVALLMTHPEEVGNSDSGEVPIRYAAVYRLQRAYVYASGTDIPQPIERTVAEMELPRSLGAAARVHLLVSWHSAASRKRREKLMRAPRYAFAWHDAGPARLSGLSLTQEADSADLIWSIMRLVEATEPTALRERSRASAV